MTLTESIQEVNRLYTLLTFEDDEDKIQRLKTDLAAALRQAEIVLYK